MLTQRHWHMTPSQPALYFDGYQNRQLARDIQDLLFEVAIKGFGKSMKNASASQKPERGMGGWSFCYIIFVLNGKHLDKKM